MMMVTRLVPGLIPTIPTIPVPYHQGRDDDSDTEEDAEWCCVMVVIVDDGDADESDAKAVTCESLVSREFSRILENFVDISLLNLDLEAFSFHFSFSISILGHFHFTFYSQNKWSVTITTPP